jgi:hypothetical protein
LQSAATCFTAVTISSGDDAKSPDFTVLAVVVVLPVAGSLVVVSVCVIEELDPAIAVAVPVSCTR